VVDKSTQAALPGANVVLLNSDPFRGTITDDKGEFRLDRVSVGRQSIRVSFIGYKELTINNLYVTAGKDLVLTIQLEESLKAIGEVVIRPENDKFQPLNDMAVISARSFTVEETERYAGSVGDPSRMASNFAGVSTLSDQQNEIVIRGNSPMGLLWRLDGVDIPNPNHFASLGTTGGGLSMINNNTLSNSDFFTGAFPAEYGNALSGVFDLNMRDGDKDHYEFTTQVGFNGLEAAAEGPISKKQGSSFMANYRYSALMLADKLVGTEILTVSAVPFYHDLSFKINFPDKKYGRFSITGIGGASGINEDESDKDTSEWSSTWAGSDYSFGSRMGSVIASHTYFFDAKTRLESYISFSGVNSVIKEDTFTVVNMDPARKRRQDSWENTLQFASNLRKKIDRKNLYDIGLNVQFIFYQFKDQSATTNGELEPQIFVKGDALFLKAYYEWQHKFSDQLELNAGINGLFFGYNKKISADPRLSFKWQIDGRQSLSLGTGIFSQLPEKMFYFVETDLPDGSVALTNKNLGYMRSFHLVMGYDFLIFENLRLKSEAYYQHLFNIPVKANEPAYSMLNFGDDSFSSLPIIDSLVNRGTGNNIGIEFTLERFLNKGYYFMFTSSLFRSTYKGYDGIERNTAFSNNFVFNLLGGKEFTIRKKNFLNIDLRTTWAGGMRYVPFHTVQAADHYYIVVREWDKAYQKRRNDYFRLNLRIGYKVNFKKATAEIACDFLNLTNQKNIYFEYYDPSTGEIKTVYQLPFLPVPLIRVQF
jgi:ethanolamine utilization microcompartment shell protein EutS